MQKKDIYVFINFSKQVILFDELVKQNEFGCVLRSVSCAGLLFYDREMDILRENKGCRDFLDSLSPLKGAFICKV